MNRAMRWFGWGLIALVVFVAVFAPWVSPYEPSALHLERRLEPPSSDHWLGLDELGRDVLSRLIYGSRVSVVVGLAVVLFAGGIGAIVGALAGFFGGRTDAVLMRITDVFFAFPGILLAISLVAVLGPALDHVIIALVAIGWVGYARLVRGQVLQISKNEFVMAGRSMGLPSLRLLIVHVFPNVLPTLAVQASLGMAGAILAEASLSFLGLGIQPPASSWGAMINAGRGHLLDAPHLALFPGLAILMTVLALNFIGDDLVDRLDPHRRAGRD